MASKKSGTPAPAGVGEAHPNKSRYPCTPGSFMKKEQPEVELDDKV